MTSSQTGERFQRHVTPALDRPFFGLPIRIASTSLRIEASLGKIPITSVLWQAIIAVLGPSVAFGLFNRVLASGLIEAVSILGVWATDKSDRVVVLGAAFAVS